MDSRQRITDPDSYTAKTMGWFNRRYVFTSDGNYFPHQPIFGFSLLKDHIGTYVRAYSILKAMQRLTFSSFLDMGCAEGYFPNLARQLFGVRSYGCDFAYAGVRKAWNIYQIPGVVGDAHRLPFKDRGIDLVLCSEVIEHVADPERVIGELTRICNQALIITTPAARSRDEREQHFKHWDPNELCGHVHFFMEEELRQWVGQEASIRGCLFRGLIPCYTRLANRPELSKNLGNFYQFMLDSCPGLAPETQKIYADAVRGHEPTGLWYRLSGPTLLKALIFIDYWLSRLFPARTAAFVVIMPCHDNSTRGRRRSTHRLLDHLFVKNRLEPAAVAKV